MTPGRFPASVEVCTRYPAPGHVIGGRKRIQANTAPKTKMKTMLSKFPGTCSKCRGPIAEGEYIAWSRATGAQHGRCVGYYPPIAPQDRRAPCWDCGDPDGKFRNFGAATPVYCDACHAIHKGAVVVSHSRSGPEVISPAAPTPPGSSWPTIEEQEATHRRTECRDGWLRDNS